VRGYLGGPGGGGGGGQNRNRQGKHRRDGNRGGGGGGGGGNGNANGNIGRHDEIYDPEPFDPSADGEIVSKADLEQARRTMSLNELRAKPITALVKVAESMGLESLARSRKQDIIFSILKEYGRNGEAVYGEGVIEILQDGFGFLRSADSSYLLAPTTSTSAPTRCGASTCAPAIPSPA